MGFYPPLWTWGWAFSQCFVITVILNLTSFFLKLRCCLSFQVFHVWSRYSGCVEFLWTLLSLAFPQGSETQPRSQQVWLSAYFHCTGVTQITVTRNPWFIWNLDCLCKHHQTPLRLENNSSFPHQIGSFVPRQETVHYLIWTTIPYAHIAIYICASPQKQEIVMSERELNAYLQPLVNHLLFSSFVIKEMFVHCIKLTYKKSVNSQSPVSPSPSFSKAAELYNK